MMMLQGRGLALVSPLASLAVGRGLGAPLCSPPLHLHPPAQFGGPSPAQKGSKRTDCSGGTRSSSLQCIIHALNLQYFSFFSIIQRIIINYSACSKAEQPAELHRAPQPSHPLLGLPKKLGDPQPDLPRTEHCPGRDDGDKAPAPHPAPAPGTPAISK